MRLHDADDRKYFPETAKTYANAAGIMSRAGAAADAKSPKSFAKGATGAAGGGGTKGAGAGTTGADAGAEEKAPKSASKSASKVPIEEAESRRELIAGGGSGPPKPSPPKSKMSASAAGGGAAAAGSSAAGSSAAGSSAGGRAYASNGGVGGLARSPRWGGALSGGAPFVGPLDVARGV